MGEALAEVEKAARNSIPAPLISQVPLFAILETQAATMRL